MKGKNSKNSVPKRHHFDKYGDQIADRPPDEFLSPKELASLIRYSVEWLEIARHFKYGPPWERNGQRGVAYRVGNLVKYFRARARLWAERQL